MRALSHAQLVSTVVIINAPSFINTLFRMASKVLSKKVLDKVTVCSSFEQACAAANLPYDLLPSFLGGGYEWDADWIPHNLRATGRAGARDRASRGQHSGTETKVGSEAQPPAAAPSGGRAGAPAQDEAARQHPKLLASSSAGSGVSAAVATPSERPQPKRPSAWRRLPALALLVRASALGSPPALPSLPRSLSLADALSLHRWLATELASLCVSRLLSLAARTRSPAALRAHARMRPLRAGARVPLRSAARKLSRRGLCQCAGRTVARMH
jgi:hypothetical protein